MPSLLKRMFDIPQQIVQAVQTMQAAQTQTPTLPTTNGWVGAAGPSQTGNPAVSHWADPEATVAATNVPAPALATTDFDASIASPTNNYNYTVPPDGGTQNGQGGQPAQNSTSEQVVLSAQTGDKPNAAVTVTETDGDTQNKDALTVTGANGGTLTDSSSTTVTTGNTATTDTSSTGISTNGTVTMTDGQSTTVTTGEDTATTADSTTITAGDGSFGVSTSNTYTTVTDGETDTTTGGVNASVNTEEGTATIGGNYSQNGNGVSGGVTFDENGVESVTGTATIHQGDFEGSVSGTFSEDQTQLSASGGANGVKVGVTYDNIHGRVTQNAVTENDHSPMANLLGGDGYLSTTRTDQTTLGGSVGIKGLGVSGDITSGSTFQSFERLPDDWETWTDEQKTDYQAQQAERMDDITGMADVDLANMPEGSGFRYTTYNGWNASAGISYGAVSVSGGGGQSSAHDVTIVNDGGMLTVSMARQDGVNTELGASLYGVGIELGNESSDTHQFQFQVDPNNPQAMEAMDVFMETGLLPGTGNLQGENAERANQRFDAARGQVDTLTGDIAAVQTLFDQQMTQPGFAESDEYFEQQMAMQEMYRQLDNAQSQMETNRNYLNDQWQAQYGVTQNPMDGVTITQETDTHQETDTVGGTSPVGNVELGRTERTWVDQEYLNNAGNKDYLFAYDEKNYFLGNMTDQQSVQTDTDESGIIFAMYSDNGITVSENADAVRDIENSDLPDYVLDAWDDRNLGTQVVEGLNPFDNPIYDGLAGRTTVAMNQEQWDAMATNLNDMNNPESAAMWADFAERSAAFMGGEQYALNVGDENQNAHFQDGMDAQRDSWLADVSSRDKATDPLAAGLYSFGPTDPEAAMQEASRRFADVKTPADFQKLTADQQQLYIAVLDMTSGQDADLTGERNSFEALGPIALITDEKARAESLRNVFVSANDEASNGGNYSDGVFEFLQFTDRFKDDPATYAMIQEGISFDWKQENIENRAEDRTPEEVAHDFNEAYWSESGVPYINRHHDPDEGRAFEAMQVALLQGGPEAVQAMMQSACADPQTLLNSIEGDPLRQRMMYDMLVGAGYDEELADYELG